MTFKYRVSTQTGEQTEGVIEAQSKEAAVSALQRRNFIVLSIREEAKKGKIFGLSFESIPMKDVVIMSRQISTLFDAQISAVKAFSLIGTNAENKWLKIRLDEVVNDIQSGTSIAGALAKHPKVFSSFYVNMVKAGEESGKLSQTFQYLADYLDRQYELRSKTKNALIYPAFVITVFFGVMFLMLTKIIPKLSVIIKDSGQAVPFYTKVVIGLSDFLVNFWYLVPVIVVGIGLFVWMQLRSEKGKTFMDRTVITLPIFGKLYRKIFLARIADNLDTMLSSGVSIVRALEITADVVGNKVYKSIIESTVEAVKSGSALSDAFARYEPIPQIMTQMIKVGEETGSMSNILRTLALFYKREVTEAVDTLIGLIEPAMIIVLGISVGLLLASVLIPIYNVAGGIS